MKARIEPGSLLPLPEHWPAQGRFGDQPIDLDLVELLPADLREEVLVEVKRGVFTYPWRHVPAVALDENGDAVGVG